MAEEKSGEVISFENAGSSHVLARKEAKLKKVQDAFKSATRDLLKDARKQRRSRKNSKNKKR